MMLLKLLIDSSRYSANVSSASVYHILGDAWAGKRTLLLDEVDNLGLIRDSP